MSADDPNRARSPASRRQLTGGFSDPDKDGDVFEVCADFPEHLSEAQAIAVLTWSASRRAGLTLEQFQARVLAAAADYFVAPAASAPKDRGGRPASDWEGEYGQTARKLEFGAVVRRAATPGLTKAEARRASLMAAKTKSNETNARDAERLKQSIRPRTGETAPQK